MFRDQTLRSFSRFKLGIVLVIGTLMLAGPTPFGSTLAQVGTVKGHQKISATEGGFAGTLDDTDQFGITVAAVGDLDGDGVTDLAVGAPQDGDGGSNRGAVWLLFLRR
ncbi:MAG: FG-GAP repeat protein [Acidobacteria bacterium]|nr:FG-GAP repeat protein [Acidobacteriota bacterium]